jgi:TrmH family RNA methyltransferase
MKTWKNNISFVLIEPKEAGNIGASARAIKNMGFKNLSLVNPRTEITDEARWFACNALDVLGKSEAYNDIRDAIKDKALVVGATRRKGKRRGVFLPVSEAARRLFEIGRKNKIAILFGREDRGLFNEEVEECGFLITIPSSKEQPSLNLAQSVLITAYELSKAEYSEGGGRDQTGDGQKLISHEGLSSLYERISRILKLLEYIPQGSRDLEKKIMRNLKHFIGRAGFTEWEMKMLHGICSQIEKKLA